MLNLLKTVTFHPKTNGHAEQYSNTLAAPMHHLLADHQHDWDTVVQPLTDAYNTQVSSSTGTILFSLALSRHQRSLIICGLPSGLPTDAKHETLQHIHRKLTTMQRRYKDHHHRCTPAAGRFKSGQWGLCRSLYLTCNSHQPTDDWLVLKTTVQAVLLEPNLSATTDNVTIDEEGILNIVSSNHVSLTLK